MTRVQRILVADDEADIRDYLRMMLARLGHQVVGAAGDGQALVEQARALAPDLVMTDIRMPGLDGIEAAAAIYQDRPTAIILISSQFDAETIERAEANPIQAYLVKPIKADDLGPAIAVATSRFRQLRQLEEALRRVQELQGLLPICSYCKKVRDDRNYWQQVEDYLAAHSNVRFSHGICPGCYALHVLPELAAQ